MPTPARRAICSSGASRPWSQTSCRAAATMAPRLRWPSRRSAGRAGLGRSAVATGHGNPGIWRVISALCQVTSRSEGYLRFVEGVVAMATGVKTTGRPDSGQAIARRAGGDRPSRDRDDTPPQAVA